MPDHCVGLAGLIPRVRDVLAQRTGNPGSSAAQPAWLHNRCEGILNRSPRTELGASKKAQTANARFALMIAGT